MSSTRIGETGSKVTYECGCCIQRPSFHNLWVREYVCGEHKAAIMLPPDVIANPAKFVEFEPKSAPDQRSFEERWHEHQEKDAALTATVSSLTAEERDVVQATLAMRQFEVLRERREVSRCYIEGETRRIRLEAIDAESEALSSAMKKLTC